MNDTKGRNAFEPMSANTKFQNSVSLSNKVTIYNCSTLSFFGGGERLIIKISDYLVSKNFSVKIVQNLNQKNIVRVKEVEIEKMTKGILSSEKFSRFGFPRFLFHDLPDLESLSRNKDSISLIFIWRIPPLSYLKMISKSGIKVIFCLHGIAIEKFRLANPLIMAHQIITRFELHYMARYLNDNIYCQTLNGNILKYLSDLGAYPRNVILIENGINNYTFTVSQNNEEFRVIFIGRIENLQKGIVRLKKVAILLYKYNPNIKFVIIGIGKDSNILKNLPKNCEYLENVNDENKYREIERANLMIITSNIEPYPLVALEAIQNGIPIVSTPASGPSHILSKDSDFGVVSSFSPRELSNEVIKFFYMWKDDKKRYYEMKMRIAKRARTLFDQEAMLENYSDMIKSVSRDTKP